jgi:acyl-coenzyme A synthetase/AMP-(fatty) acid ligase
VEGTLVSYGNIIKAFVILRAGQKPSDRLKQNLKYHVRMTLGPIAQPDDIEFVTSSPRPGAARSCAASSRQRRWG